MKVSLLTSDSSHWARAVERARHDFYHLPAYASMSAALDGGKARALLVEDGERSLLFPLVVRPVPDGGDAWDASSPYGYPGPLVVAPEGERARFAGEALRVGRDALRGEGCVSLFARLHPVLGPVPDLTGVEGAAIVEHGETVVLDLRQSEAEMWRHTSSGHRNEINRSIRAGHVARVDTEFEHLDRFVAIYQETMSRVGASAYYFFDRDYVLSLRDALGPRLSLAVVEIGGVVAAAGLFVETCGIVEYHLSGADPVFMRERPTKLMLHFVRQWAKARGNTILHFGGGVGGQQDSLFRFKAGFSQGRAPFHTLRMIVDPKRYDAMLATRDVPPTDFFPAYRRR